LEFSGILKTNDGVRITNAEILLKVDKPLAIDPVLGVMKTNEYGEFYTYWEGIRKGSEKYIDFYVVFEGSRDFLSARSDTNRVTIIESDPQTTQSKYQSTQVTLDRIPSKAYTDQSITFTGRLTSNENPINDGLVFIYEDDPLKPDQRIGYTRTDSNGNYSITWKVEGGLVEIDFDIYAYFEPDDNRYRNSQSDRQTLTVLKYGGSLDLDPFPKSANIGDVVTFSGTLKLNKGSPEGAVVYIKDEDPLNPDDLLAAAYVDYDGKFITNWIVERVDADYQADIYAVFEGNDILFRLTTCDDAPTMPIGGMCLNTIPFNTNYVEPPTRTPPPTSSEYMELYYSLDFKKNPRVAIVPTPDDYDTVRKYITTTKEGILLWESYMEQRIGGNWNVDFEVVTPDKLFFSQKPDVIITLTTKDPEFGCYDTKGWARMTEIKPIPASVCVTSYGSERTWNAVAGTAAHEFVHSVGLGHTFNSKNDLMCSYEYGMPTCPKEISRPDKPSDLNLYALSTIYGNDGFKNPNNYIFGKQKFYLTDNVDSEKTVPSPQPPVSEPTPTPPKPQPVPNPNVDTDGDGIRDLDDLCPTQKENYNGIRDWDGCYDTSTLKPFAPYKYIDTDGDGIEDSKDLCTTQKETRNGYKDWDGCPDAKPIDWKKKSIGMQKHVNQMIIDEKNGIILAEHALRSTWYSDKHAQAQLENAWEHLWWAKKYLGDAEWTQKEGEKFISNSQFKDAYYKYKYSSDMGDKINHHLAAITRFIDNAHNIVYG